MLQKRLTGELSVNGAAYVRFVYAIPFAWIYVANPAVIANQIKPARWYIEHLLAGRGYLSDDYWQRINLVECGAHGVEWS